MKNIKLILTIALAITTAFFLYYAFNAKSQLKEAENIIENVNSELLILKDSIQASQASLEALIKELDYTTNQLDILKNEREAMALEEQKKRARNWAELQALKEQILALEAEKERLKKEAEKFEL